MDWIEFGSKAIEHAVWPLAVLYVARSQRAAVGDLIRNIKKAKGPGGFELEVAERTQKLKVDTELLEAKPVEPPKLESPNVEIVIPAPGAQFSGGGVANFNAEATLTVGESMSPDDWRKWLLEASALPAEYIRPSAVILEQWKVVEDGIRRIAVDVDPKTSRMLATPSNLLLHLVSTQVLSRDTFHLARELNEMRDLIARTTIELEYRTAQVYVDSCKTVLERMHSEAQAWKDVRKLANDWDEQMKIKK